MTAPDDLPADPEALVALARPVAEAVGRQLIESVHGEGPTVRSKSTATDLVTDLDTWAERYITEQLLAARPDDSVMGEEGADHRGTSGLTWCVDPIDGTVNFVHGLAGFNISIAAQVGGHSVAAVVMSPLHGDTFTAVTGGGAFCNDRPIRCSTQSDIARAVVGTGFGYDPDRRRRQAEVVTKVIGSIADIRRIGAAAIDLCSVGAGRLDAYWEVGLNPWDHAAGGLIATEAGARCAGIDGTEASATSVLAAPDALWDPLAELLIEARAADV